MSVGKFCGSGFQARFKVTDLESVSVFDFVERKPVVRLGVEKRDFNLIIHDNPP